MYSSDFKSLAIKLYHKIKSLRKVSIMIETSHSSISRWINYNYKTRKRQVRGLLFLEENNIRKLINRDINAAKNILKCFRAGSDRPPGFNRSVPKLKDVEAPFTIKSNKMPVEEILSESSWLELFNYSINHKSNKWQKSSLMDNIFYPRQLELYLKNA